MAKRSVTFRFSEETLDLLDGISQSSGLTRTRVIEDLIQGAWGGSEPRVAKPLAPSPRKAGPDRDKLAAFAQQNMAKGKSR